MIINLSIKMNLFKPGKEKIKNHEASAPTNVRIFSSYMAKTWCVGGKHYSNTNNTIEYEKVNPETRKHVKIIKRNCNIYGRNKSQIPSK